MKISQRVTELWAIQEFWVEKCKKKSPKKASGQVWYLIVSIPDLCALTLTKTHPLDLNHIPTKFHEDIPNSDSY